MASIEERLIKKIEELESISMASKYLVNLNDRIAEEEKEIEELRLIVELEYQDIKKLERLSIVNIFSKVLGDVNSMMEKEKQEYLESILDYKDANKMLALLNYEKAIVKTKIDTRPEKEKELKALMDLREAELLSLSNNGKNEINIVNHKIDSLIRLRREIFEAKIIGNYCKRMVKQILLYLHEAKKLRAWSVSNKTGDYRKEKTQIDKAVEVFYKLKVELIKFESELSDVFIDTKHEFSTYSNIFKNFKERYYNHIIGDWVVKKRLSNTIEETESIDFRILEVIRKMVKSEEIVLADLENQQKIKRRLILESLKT